MKMHFPILLIFLFVLVLSSLLIQFKLKNKRHKTILSTICWLVPLFFLIGFLVISSSSASMQDHPQTMLWFISAFLLVYTPMLFFLFFLLIDMIILLFCKKETKLSSYAGIPLAVLLLALLAYGILNRYEIDVRRAEVVSDRLPEKFDGTKIIQISDVHLGNLSHATEFLNSAATLINKEKPDFIFLTGDLVNLKAEEGDGYGFFFDKLYPQAQKIAVLGNHDYGDYYPFENDSLKKENMKQVKLLFEKFHFRLLPDTFLCVRKDSANQIGIIGVENWSKPPFRSYGNLNKALQNLPKKPFNILLSHDPNHWKAEVLGHKNITLTLSGHTHGAQIGIECGNFKFSPSQWLFKQWDGLYESNGQFLFVNRGLGYVGIPLRLGMKAEISVITLKCGKNVFNN